MKPSVARKLNEKIRALEAELDQLRSNKKVKELEKKVTVSWACQGVRAAAGDFLGERGAAQHSRARRQVLLPGMASVRVLD
jgi:hypothetical protein